MKTEETTTEETCPNCDSTRYVRGTCGDCGYDADEETTTWLVIESTPGYMPDADEPADFTDYADAVAYANELANELEEQGYSCDRSWVEVSNYYAVHCELPREATVAPDLGRFIAVERAED